MNYGDFISGIRKRIWTYPGEAKSLVPAHDQHFQEAMIDLCKWVECLQETHTEVSAACSTYVQCGLTITDAPYGEIERVYTIANDDWCNKVYYDRASYQRVLGWQQRLLRDFVPPANTGLPALQQGIRYPDKSTDSRYGRSRAGIWAVHRGRLYIGPWLQSNETLVVEWRGVKTSWKPEDLLDETYWTPDVAQAIKKYVQWQHIEDFLFADTVPADLNRARQSYLDARADRIFWCEERTKEKDRQAEATVFLEGDALPTSNQLTAEAVPTEDDTSATDFAIVGDFGGDNQAEADVAALIKSWKPGFIVTTGDNWYGVSTSDLGLSSIDQMVGKYYAEFLFPYLGSYGDGADGLQRMFATLGNHDFDPSGRLATSLQYFAMPGRYYTFVKGPVQFFIIDSGYDHLQVLQEADGNTFNSVQGQWLQANLALSTATFKVVVFHHPPFTSSASVVLTPPLAGDGTLSYPALRWPFKTWGADLVINGHARNYERLVGSDGMLYVINGAGGREGTAPGEPALFKSPPLATSVFRYGDDFGAQKCSVTCSQLKLEFFARGGTLIDTLTIDK